MGRPDLFLGTPNGEPDALLSDGENRIRVSTRNLVAVACALFPEGAPVRFNLAMHGHVARDLGDVVEVTTEFDRGTGFGKRTYVTSISRGTLAAANFNRLATEEAA